MSPISYPKQPERWLYHLVPAKRQRRNGGRRLPSFDTIQVFFSFGFLVILRFRQVAVPDETYNT
jgi:hypothetical protein